MRHRPKKQWGQNFLRDSSAVRRIVDAVAAEPNELILEIGPGEVEQILHRDEDIYPVPRPHPELVMNVMWAFDDFTEAKARETAAGPSSVVRR